ncbi:MAG: hypothetical protein AABY30_03435 [Candidatus Thermoplasmatota archaeon]
MRRALAAVLLLVLLAPGAPRASAVPPNDLFLFFERTVDVSQYVNGSTVEAWAALNFSGNPDPPPQIDNIEFRWYAPNGTLAATATVDPDANAWALGTLRVTTEGVWAVNATYLGTPSLSANRTFAVLPATWSGTVVLAGSTMVGGNATLTVAAGTSVRSDPGVYLRVKGDLSAVGTPAQPIVFTANASSPAPGAWKTLLFHPESGNRSVLEQVRIQYPEDGVRLLEAAPRIANVSVSDAAGDGFRLTNVAGRLFEVGVTRATNGFWIDRGTVELENATARDVSYGIVAGRVNLTVRNGAITSAAQIGVSATDASLDLTAITFQGGGVGLASTGGIIRGEELAFAGLTDGVDADAANVAIGNSTFAATVARHFSVKNGARVQVVNGAFPPVGESASLTSGSELTLWNYLDVRVVDHDASDANLSGASVSVHRNDAPVFAGTTDGTGTIPALLLLHRRWAPTPSEGVFRILVALAGYAFEDNNRTLRMDAGTAELFRGSTADLDEDGEPDFSDADVDGDGLLNDAEGILNTDPRDPDTDGDGLPDGWEFDFQLNPLDAGDADDDADRDGPDGLTATEEYGEGTDPRTRDTDGDRMDDGWEVRYELNPTNASDADDDPDGDGFTNLEEYRGGSNPRDPNSRPSAGLGAVWPFAVALVAAVTIIILSLVISRRRKARAGEPPPEEEKEE